MWYKFAAIKVNDKEIPEEDFFNKFVNVATNDNKQHYWIVNGEKYAPPENYGHNYTSMMLKLQHGIYPNDPSYNETPIEFVGRGLGSFAKGGTIRVSQMIDTANLSIYGPVEENTIGDILKFLPAESIGTWEILNVPNNPSGNGFNSLKQTIDNLNLGLEQKSKEEVDIKPIQRVDNTPSFYKGRSGD
jgi:hypothetical protein